MKTNLEKKIRTFEVLKIFKNLKNHGFKPNSTAMVELRSWLWRLTLAETVGGVEPCPRSHPKHFIDYLPFRFAVRGPAAEDLFIIITVFYLQCVMRVLDHVSVAVYRLIYGIRPLTSLLMSAFACLRQYVAYVYDC